MSEWIAWSPCSATCGPGSRSRSRYMTQFPDDGSPCSLPTEETDSCLVNDECCEFRLSAVPFTSCVRFGLSHPPSPFLPAAASSCLVTEWAEWDACSATCGVGMKTRERKVERPRADGNLCEAELLEVEKCMMPECRE